MKSLILISILIITMLAAGCSSSYVVSSSAPGADFDLTSFQDFNSFAQLKWGLITSANDSVSFNGYSIQIKSDSLFWIDKSGVTKSADLAWINEVVLMKSSAWEGIGLGFLGGAVAGWIIAKITVPDPTSGAGMGGIFYLIDPVLGGIIGALIGSSIEGSIGLTYSYKFQKNTR